MSRLPEWSARILERRLAQVFQRPVTVGRVGYRLVPFQAEVRDIRVAGLRPEDPPFLEVPRAVAATAPRRLWDGEVDILELRVQRPRVHIHAFPQGGDDIPKLRMGGGGRGSLRVRRVIVEGGELWVDHDRVPLDLDLPEVRLRLAEGEGGRLRGALAAGPGQARFGANAPFPLDTEATLALEGGRVSVESGRFHMPEGNLTFRGQVNLSPLRGEFTASGPVDLGILDRHVLQTGFGLQGSARYRGDVRVVGSRLRLAGRMEGTRGVFDGVAVPRYAGEVRWDENGVQLKGLQTTVMGGTATFDVHVPPVPAPARVEARLDGVDAEEATAYLFDLGRAGLGAGARGTVSLQWPRGRVRELSGRVDLELDPRADGRTPLSGRLAWRAQEGHQVVEDASLVTPATQARLRGTIDRASRTDLAVEAGSTDLALSDALGVRVRRALGRADAEPVGLSGHGGAFSGRWRGTLQEPVFEGRFTGQEVTFLGVPWGRAEWAGSTDPREVQYRSLVLRRGGAEMWLDGRMETGFYGDSDALDVRVRLKDWPARDLITALQWDLQMDGPVSGEATVRGRRSAPEGGAHLRSASGQYYGMPYEELDVRSRFGGGITTVDAGHARAGGGRVAFEGTVTGDGIYDGEAQPGRPGRRGPHRAHSARLPRRGPGLRGRRPPGHAGASAAGRAASLPGLSLGEQELGALEVRATGRGDGQVAVDGTLRSAQVDLGVSGRVGAAPPYHAELAAALKQSSLDAFLRAAFPAVPAATALVATATGQVRGPLATPRALGGQVTVSALEIRLPDYPIRNRAPVRVAVREGRLDVESLQMSGEGTDLEVLGGVDIQGTGGLDLRVQGATDLRAVSLFSQELRGRGRRGSPWRSPAPGTPLPWTAPWRSRERGCGCAASPTASRTCAASCASTGPPPRSRESPAAWAAAPWSWRAGPPRRAAASPPSTSRPRAAD